MVKREGGRGRDGEEGGGGCEITTNAPDLHV